MIDKKSKIMNGHKQGQSVKYLANTFGIWQQTVQDIVKKSGQDLKF